MKKFMLVLMTLMLTVVVGCDPNEQPVPVDTGDSWHLEDEDILCFLREWYVDADGDGYGSEHEGVKVIVQCEKPWHGRVDNDYDCDDNDPDVMECVE